MFKKAKECHHLAFTKELVFWESTRKRQDILKCLALFTRFVDLKHDTEFHYELLKWMKKKDLKWNSAKKVDTYQLAKIIPIELVLERINQLPEKYKIFATFVLMTGLGTSETKEAFNNHGELCNNGVMELFWDRNTKKRQMQCIATLYFIIKSKIRQVPHELQRIYTQNISAVKSDTLENSTISLMLQK